MSTTLGSVRPQEAIGAGKIQICNDEPEDPFGMLQCRNRGPSVAGTGDVKPKGMKVFDQQLPRVCFIVDNENDGGRLDRVFHGSTWA